MFLGEAATGMPYHSRVSYNLGLLQLQLGKDTLAKASLESALKIEPGNLDYLYALADFYLKRGRWKSLEKIAEEMVAWHPNQRIGHDILKLVGRQKGQ